MWVPSEFLDIKPDQPVHKDLSELVVSDIIRHTARSANVNKNDIANDGLLTLGLRNGAMLVSELTGPRCWCQFIQC